MPQSALPSPLKYWMLNPVKPEAPYYESRYVRANHPDRAQALWLRETLLLPTAGDPVADVWVMVFDPDGAGNRALKQPYPIDAAAYEYDDWTARIGATSIDDQSAQGVVTGGGRSARWDLRITPGSEDAVKLLTDRAYKARIPTAKTTVRHPLAQFDGQVELDDTRLVLDGWTGSVNHNWGTRHTPAYAFGQVCGFDDAPDSSLEIVTARAAVGPVLLPAATLFVFRHAGQEFAVRSILGSHADPRPVSAVLVGVRRACWGSDDRGRDRRRARRRHRADLHRHRRRLEVLLQLGNRHLPSPGGG